MISPTPTIQSLYEALILDIAKAFALPQTPGAHRLVGWVFGKAARRVAALGLDLDREVELGGLPQGARWLLKMFVKDHSARGAEIIPSEGPLIIVSNHPANVDSMVISAHVTRSDYKAIIDDIPYFERLPHLRERIILAPVSDRPAARIHTARESIRHLKSGGSLLLFARGGIEADPEFMPHPDGEFEQWSRSLEVFLKHVPETRVLIAIVSGVIARASMKNPLTYFRKARPDRQRIAFLTQLARQILSGREIFGLTPRVTFGEVIEGGHQHVLDQVHESARRVLRQHMEWK
jgi:hypothetical protein